MGEAWIKTHDNHREHIIEADLLTATLNLCSCSLLVHSTATKHWRLCEDERMSHSEKTRCCEHLEIIVCLFPPFRAFDFLVMEIS